RGRIALAQHLAADRIEASAALVRHLDQCLACMSCERVCPSGVRYGELLVETRALLHEKRRPNTTPSWLTNPRTLRIGLQLTRIPGRRAALRSRIAQALLKPFGLARAAREMPRLPIAAAWPKPRAATRGRVGLFLGCAAELADRDVHPAAAKLL